MAEEKPQESVYNRVRRAAREEQKKEAERMRRFNELLRRENTDDELSKKLGR
jgi:Trp operon repressor